MYVEFILDGAGAKPGEEKTFPLKIVVDPVIKNDREDTQLYVNHAPCVGGIVDIKVGIFSGEIHVFYMYMHILCCMTTKILQASHSSAKFCFELSGNLN